MLAQKLRNIFIKKYVSKLQNFLSNSQKFQFSEKQVEGKDSAYHYKGYMFSLRYEHTVWHIIFEDYTPRNSNKEKTRVVIDGFRDWFATEPLSSDDWKRFYGQLNHFVSRLFARVVADSLTLWVTRNVVYDDKNQNVTIKFTLQRIHLAYENANGDTSETSFEITDDAVERIKTAIIYMFGLL